MVDRKGRRGKKRRGRGRERERKREEEGGRERGREGWDRLQPLKPVPVIYFFQLGPIS
jgi:hypothetical protein